MTLHLTPVAGAAYEKTTLANGLRVVTASMPHTRSAAVQFYVGVGARHERPDVSGISHFVEHMVFKGTARRPGPLQISEAIEGVGGALNAATDHEHTNYRALVPSDYLGTAIDVLSDMLLSATFAPDEVAKERTVIIEELNSTFDSPPELVDLLFDELLWGDHALGRDVAGSRRTVRRIQRPDLVDHVSSHYRPDRVVVSVAGNVDHEQVVHEVARRWGDLPAQRPDPRHERYEPAPQPAGPKMVLRRKRTEQTNFIVGVPARPYTHEERYVQDVLDAVLGCGMSSRLFVEIRENRGLAYAISSLVKTYGDAGAFGVYAAVDNHKLPDALGAILGELARLVDEGVPEHELRKVKEYIKGHALLSLERSSYLAHWGGWQELMLGRIEPVEVVLERIEEVTAEDVQRLSRALFTTGNLHLAAVGPGLNEAQLSEQLRLD